MIAELFYPKELKEVIADLRSKGDLNDVPLRKIYWVVNYFYFPLFLFSVVGTYSEYINPNKGIELPIFFSCVMPLVIWLYVRGGWRTYMASYFFGNITRGEIISGRVREMGSIIFKVKNIEDGVYEKVYAIDPIKFSHSAYMPKKGDEIIYYRSRGTTYSAVPRIVEYMKRSCLSKSMIEEATKNSEN